MNAFVVEDNKGIREILVDLLEGRGHTVAAFEDAESALPVLQTTAFELGIMDWGLPGIDGLELCRRYRAESHSAGSIIIILTGRAEPDDLDEVVAAGANDYITKPFKLDALETRVAFAERRAVLRAGEIQVEQNLRKANASFKSLIESIPIITYIEKSDDSREIEYISPQIEQIMGWTPSEVISSPGFWVELLHPDDLETALDAEKLSDQQTARFSLEYRQRCRNGEYRWFRDDAEPILDENGKILHWHGAISDITSHREFEDALKEQERFYRDLSIASERQTNELRLLDRIRSVASKELELSTVFRLVVEATSEILGYPFTSIYMRDGDRLVLQHHVGYDDESAIIHVVNEGEGISGTVGFLGIPRLITDTQHHPDFLSANDRVAYEICVPLFDDHQVAGVINIETAEDQPLTPDDLRMLEGVADHVSAAISRSRLYDAARENERRLRSVLDEVREVVFQADIDGRWTFLNKAWEEISGFTIEESLGRDVMEFTVPEDQEAMRSSISDFRSGLVREIRGNFEIWTATRGRRWLEAHATGVGEPPDIIISGTLTDITERKHAEEALKESQDRYRHLALHDPLTSLPNRTLFMERMEEALQSCAYNDTALSVLYLDLDGFKLVNDSFGHDAGDKLLVQVAERLNRTLRVGDTVARLGGDEFALLIEDRPDFPIAQEISQRILDSFREPFTLQNQEITLATSIGIASHLGPDGRANHLLRNADTALYAAKASGRGMYARYQPRMSAAVLARYQQESELRTGIEDSQFALRYEPVFDLRSNEIVSIEASVLWDNPNHGLIPATDFQTLADSTGLSVRLGETVLRLACEDIVRWRESAAAPHPVVMIKLSARQIRETGLASSIGKTLADFGIEPARFEFIIAEPSPASDDGFSRSTLTELRKLGVGLILENVGSGHGTLRALREMPINAVRIDPDFVQDLNRDRSCKEIVRAMTALAQNLGMTVTAEGIENIDQLSHARSLGIDRASGPHFAGPMSAHAIRELMTNRQPQIPGAISVRR